MTLLIYPLTESAAPQRPDGLVFHTLSIRRPFDTAMGLVEELPWGAGVPIGDLVDAVQAFGRVPSLASQRTK